MGEVLENAAYGNPVISIVEVPFNVAKRQRDTHPKPPFRKLLEFRVNINPLPPFSMGCDHEFVIYDWFKAHHNNNSPAEEPFQYIMIIKRKA